MQAGKSESDSSRGREGEEIHDRGDSSEDDYISESYSSRWTESEDWFNEEIHDGKDSFEADCSPGFAVFRALEENFHANLPDFGKIESKNVSMLRSMAVAYFYQSNFKTCRETLKKMRTLEDGNLGDSLMLAECELALDGDDTKREADNFISIGLKSDISPENIIDWDEKLVKIGRFLGGLLLQYLAFRKHTKQYHLKDTEEDHRDTRMTKAIHRARLVERKRFLHFSLGKIAYRVARTKHVMWHHAKNKHLLIDIFDRLRKQLKEFCEDRDQAQMYAQALCLNCCSWCEMSRNASVAFPRACDGLKRMNEYGDDRSLRLLYGDLHTNKAMSSYFQSIELRPVKIAGLELNCLESAEEASLSAIEAYEEAADYKGTPHEKIIARDMGKWTKRYIGENPPC